MSCAATVAIDVRDQFSPWREERFRVVEVALAGLQSPQVELNGNRMNESQLQG